MPAARCLGAALLALLLALAEADEPAGECQVAVIGAGWAGVYAAWRLGVDAGPTGGGVDARQICVFEAYRRPGGRTYTTSIQDYRVDVGAYRFAGDMHLPADLIMGALGMPTACYDPTCTDDDVRGEVKWPYKLPLRKIVDFSGRQVGYGAAISGMLDKLVTSGARLAFGRQLASIASCDGKWCLKFADGGSVAAARVVLNIPRPALAQVQGVRQAVGQRWEALGCVSRQFPKHVTEGRTTVKVYAVYEDAWWVSRLNLLRGVAEDMQEPPVSIHYHDGEVLCSTSEDPGEERVWTPARDTASRGRCRGVLQVFYRHSQLCPSTTPGCMEFWSSLPRRSASEPATVLEEGGVGDSPELRKAIHEKLIAMHAVRFSQRNVSQAGIAPPQALAYSVWAHSGTFSAGDHGMQSGPQDVIFASSLDSSCPGVPSVDEYQHMVQGTGSWADVGRGLHFANNDFAAASSSTWHGPWSEASLLSAERTLAQSFGLGRPSWLNASYYSREVELHSSSEALSERQVLV